MSKRPTFRARRGKKYNDLEELRRLNKLVQNKQSRIRTGKGVETVGVETKKIDDFTSRKEYNQYKKRMNEFLKRDSNFFVKNENQALIEYKDLREYEKTIKKVNKEKRKQWEQFKDKPFTHRGFKTGMSVEQVANPNFGIGDPRYGEYKPLKYNPNRWRSGNEFYKELKEKKEIYNGNWVKRKNEMYRDHYLKAIDTKLGKAGGRLRAGIASMDLDSFITKFHTENNAHIDFIYDKFDIDTKVSELEKVWGVN